LASLFFVNACKKKKDPLDDNNTTLLNDSLHTVSFRFRFDPNQARLDSLGQVSSVPSGNAAVSVSPQKMSIHYIELFNDPNTPIGQGVIAYKTAEEPSQLPGYTSAILFDKSLKVGENTVFLKIPKSRLGSGTFQYIRVGVGYMKFDTKFDLINVPFFGKKENQNATLAAFTGYNTKINKYVLYSQEVTVNSEKQKGYWAIETRLDSPLQSFNTVKEGQLAYPLTVVNELSGTLPSLPRNSIMTGKFKQPITVVQSDTVSFGLSLVFSNNNFFEWKDANGNGKWDIDAGNNTIEDVVDFGLRGVEVLKD
jgi:hypothetical protein